MIWKVGKILCNRRFGNGYESSKYTNIEQTLFQILSLHQEWSHKEVSEAYIALLHNPTPAPAGESQGDTSEDSDYRLRFGPGGGRGGGPGGGPRGGSRGSRRGGSRGGAGRREGSPQRERKRKGDDDKPNKERQNEDKDAEIVEFDGRYLGQVSHARVKQWIAETSQSSYF